MNKSLIKPMLFFIMVFVAVSLACGSTSEPTQEPEIVTPEEPEVTEPEETGPVSVGASNLEAVQGAVIQIQAEGTFVDPQIGQ